MPRSRVYQTEAIIIKRAQWGEADRIVTLYTPHLGKLRAIAKGACRPQSKLGGHVELFTHSRMLLARGRNLDIITQSQTIEGFFPLKSDLQCIAYAFYFTELIDRFTAERIENPPLFDLLRETLGWLCQGDTQELLLHYFELHLLHYLGYRPQLYYCVSCGSPLQPVVNLFSPSSGGVLCPDCVQREPLAFSLTVNALKVLRLLQNTDYAAARRLHIGQALAAELRQSMQRYISYLLDGEIKSATWLDKLKRMPIKD